MPAPTFHPPQLSSQESVARLIISCLAASLQQDSLLEPDLHPDPDPGLNPDPTDASRPETSTSSCSSVPRSQRQHPALSFLLFELLPPSITREQLVAVRPQALQLFLACCTPQHARLASKVGAGCVGAWAGSS